MSETTSRSVTNMEIAKEVESLTTFDPALGSYSFADMGQAVQFANLMSRAGEMLPAHLREKPALCLAVVMRASQWKFDPFGLAGETYQASSGGVIGYQAKVFVAALRQCAGIALQYEYSGELQVLDKPTTSSRGNQISPKSVKGNRTCTAFAIVDGVRLEYTTPELDNITIRNSPLWVNDTDQQLAYYAGRGWGRRHRPEVMFGAYSTDEVREMNRMRDVTPKQSGFAQLAADARDAAKKAEAEKEVDQTDAPEQEEEIGDDADVEPDVDTDSPAYKMGLDAGADEMFERGQCPFKGDAENSRAWLAGFDAARPDQSDD